MPRPTPALTAGLAAATLAASCLAMPTAHATTTAQAWAGWITPSGVPAADQLQTRVATGTITGSDVGQTLQLRLTPDSSSTVDCDHQSIGYTSSATHRFTTAERDWQASGCWSGGVNLVTRVTADMVGSEVSLNGYDVPAAGADRFAMTGQVSLAGSVQQVHTSAIRGGTGSPAAGSTPEPAASPSAQPTTPTPPATQNPGSGETLASLPRIPWEGGASYYSQFPDAARAGWNKASHFPIGLWWGQVSSDSEVAYDKSKGINTYVVTNSDTDYHLFDRNGVSYVGTALKGQPRSSTSWVGDFLDDEVDGRYDKTEGPAYLAGLDAKLPDHDKFRYTNYTGMVISWLANNPTWAAAAKAYTNDFSDVESIDAYWFSSPQCDWADPNGQNYLTPFTKANCRTSQNYGRTVTSLRQQDAADGKLQPIWNFIEDVDVAPDGVSAHMLTPAEVKGAAMSSIIHEARGLMWFNNSFGGACASGNAIRQAQHNPNYPCTAQVDAMGEVNTFIESLAPVLNTQSYAWNFGPGVETMLKSDGGSAYVFAMPTDAGTNSGAGSKTFTVPAALKGRTIQVVGEDRTIPMAADGTFTDRFASLDSYHVYKIG